MFIGDNSKYIQSNGSNCVMDKIKDNELAVKLITKYLVFEKACICNLALDV